MAGAAAVAREISNNDLIGAMSRGLVDKYGADFVSSGYQSDVYRYWVDSPAMAMHFDGSTGSDCTPVWPELVRIPQAYLNRDCGAFVRQLHRQTLLIDTRHLAAHAAVIAARIAAAAAAPQAEPVIEF